MDDRINILIAGLLLCCTACVPHADPESAWMAAVPHKANVGAANLPDTIAPVNAPFAMPRFSTLKFPDYVVTLNPENIPAGKLATGTIQAAIEDVHARGGGRVVIPQGLWKTGRIILKSHVELHLEEGSVLQFSADVRDYHPAVFTRNEGIELYSLGACIYAHGQQHIAVTGTGKLVGPGPGTVRQQTMTHDVIERVVPLDKPVDQRVYEGDGGGTIFPPAMISPIGCRQVYIEGITLEQSAFWNVVPIYCNDVVIRGITVNSVGIPRGDGIDVESSQNVLIEYCTLNAGDDCIAIKAGRGIDGQRVNRPSENVVVRHCLMHQGHGGVTVGSETAGMVRNLYVHDCVFEGTGIGIRFKTRRPRGGGGESLYYERIRMNVEQTALRWDMLGSALHVGELASDTPLPVTPLTPRFSDITVRHVIVESAADFMKVDGIPESPLTGVSITACRVASDRFVRLKHAVDIQLSGIHFAGKDSTVNLYSCRNIGIERVVTGSMMRPAVVSTGNSDGIRIK